MKLTRCTDRLGDGKAKRAELAGLAQQGDKAVAEVHAQLLVPAVRTEQRVGDSTWNWKTNNNKTSTRDAYVGSNSMRRTVVCSARLASESCSSSVVNRCQLSNCA